MLCLCFGLHLRNGFDLALENEETLVLQIDTACFEEGGDFREGAGFVIDCVARRVVLVCGTANDQG